MADIGVQRDLSGGGAAVKPADHSPMRSAVPAGTAIGDTAGRPASSTPDPDTIPQDLRREASELLNREARAVRPRLRIAIVAGLGLGCLVMAQAWLVSWLLAAGLDGALSSRDMAVGIATLLGVLGLRGACAFVQETAGTRAAQTVKSSLRMRLLERRLQHGPDGGESQTGASVALLIDQVEALHGYFAHFLVLKPLAVAVPLLILGVAFSINWVVGCMLLALAPCVPLSMALIGKRAAAANRRQFRVLTRMGAMFLDRLQGMTTLVLFGAADREAGRLETVAAEFRQSTMAVLRVAFLSSTALEVFSAGAIALVASYVGLTLAGVVTLAPETAPLTVQSGLFLLLLAPEFFAPLRQMAMHYHDRMAAAAAAESFVPLLRDESDCRSRAAPAAFHVAGPPPIVLDRVSLVYPGGRRPALDDVSFTADPGRITALIGQSGSGKTSIVNILLGFRLPTAGQVLIDGVDITRVPRDALHAPIAWVGQSPQLFHGTLRENIALGCPDTEPEAVLDAARRAGVMDFAAALPDGLDHRIGERGVGLSGGQAQRLALARAFLKDAPILVLDEPTAHLDLETERDLLVPLLRLARGRTTILATHSDTLARHAHRTIRMDAGRVVEDRVNAGAPA